MELDERSLTLEGDQLMGAGERIDGSAEDVVSGDVAQVSFGLGERDELGRGAIGIEREKTVLLGEAEIGGHFGGKGCTISLFLE